MAKNRRSRSSANDNRAVVEQRSTNRNKFIGYFSLGTVIVILFTLVLSLNFQSNVTGSAISVQYHGLSGQPSPAHKGLIQTSVSLNKPLMIEMRDLEVRSQTAQQIISSADMTEGIVSLFAVNVLDHPSVKDQVRELAVQEKANFQANTVCLRTIAYNHAQDNLDLVMVSELKQRACANNNDNKVFYVQHSFWETNDDFICMQDDANLFIYDSTSNTISAETAGC